MAAIRTNGFSFLTNIFRGSAEAGYHDYEAVTARWSAWAVDGLNCALAAGGLRQALETAEYNAAAAYDDGCGCGAEVYEVAAEACRVALGREAERFFAAAYKAAKTYRLGLPKILIQSITDWMEDDRLPLPVVTVAQAKRVLRKEKLEYVKTQAWVELIACSRRLQDCEVGSLEQARFWLERANELLRLTKRRVGRDTGKKHMKTLSFRPFADVLSGCCLNSV